MTQSSIRRGLVLVHGISDRMRLLAAAAKGGPAHTASLAIGPLAERLAEHLMQAAIAAII